MHQFSGDTANACEYVNISSHYPSRKALFFSYQGATSDISGLSKSACLSLGGYLYGTFSFTNIVWLWVMPIVIPELFLHGYSW